MDDIPELDNDKGFIEKSSPRGSRDPTPDQSFKREYIDTLIERKHQMSQELKPKGKLDHTYLQNLQSQMVKNNSKISDLNHKYNIVEQKYKTVN